MFTVPDLTDGKWHFLAWSRKDKEIYLYMDGEKKGEDTFPSSCNTNINIDELKVGQDINGGYLDELKIFDKSLTKNQIQEIYNNEKDKKNYDGSERGCKVCDGLILNYKMDECKWDGTSGEVKDSSGSGHNGTGRNGINTDYGHLCLAGEFDGENDYIDTGYDFHWSRDDNFTIMAWVYINDVD
jgi:hypothetical protein